MTILILPALSVCNGVTIRHAVGLPDSDDD